MRRTIGSRLGALAMAAALLLSTAAQASADEPSLPSPPAVPVTGVEITTPGTRNIVEKGEVLALTVEVRPSNATNKAVTWASSDPKVASVDQEGRVTGMGPGKATLTVTTVDGGKSAKFDVECSGISLSRTSLELLVNDSQSVSFPQYGAAKGKAVEWSSSNISVADVSGGTINARNPGTATITASVFGTGYSAVCSVVVKEDLAGAIELELDAGGRCSFDDSDLHYELDRWCRTKTGGRLEYLTGLSVPPGQGVVYYGYVSPDAHGHGVGGTERYHVGRETGKDRLEDLSFIPTPGFAGTAVISYTGYADNGKSFHGTIRVEVEKQDDVSYSTAEDRPQEFTAAEFTAVCQARTGRSIRHITFELPSPSRGVLYYNYSAAAEFSQQVDSGTRYYPSGTPSLDRITFVPAEDFRGTVTIPYQCVDSAGGSYRGNVTILVYSAAGAERGTVEYTTRVDRPVDLSSADFNAACREANGSNLNYVTFQLPPVRKGILYYDYRSHDHYGSRVDEGTRYYRSGGKEIDDITFVPEDGFEGVVTIPFSGADKAGERFSGELTIQVLERWGDGTVRYTTETGKAVALDREDLQRACREQTGSALEYVRFQLPSRTQGTMYADYVNQLYPGAAVSESVRYYRSGTPDISALAFVPASGYAGTVTIGYDGRAADGRSFSGSIEIEVRRKEAELPGWPIYFSDVPQNAYYYDAVRWAVGAGITGGTAPGIFGPELSCTRAQMVTFLWRAAGSPAPQIGWTSFRDVDTGAYYYQALLWAVGRGITSGTTPTTFSPNAVVDRGQAIAMLYRSVGTPVSGIALPFSDVLAGDYYAPAVRWAVFHQVATGVDQQHFAPRSPCTRAQIVSFLYKSAALR